MDVEKSPQVGKLKILEANVLDLDLDVKRVCRFFKYPPPPVPLNEYGSLRRNK